MIYKHVDSVPPKHNNSTKEYSWNVEDCEYTDGKIIIIYHYGEPVMKLSGHEVIECFGKRFVEQHTETCNKLKHLRYWNSTK